MEKQYNTFNVFIEGVAASYNIDSVWKILFPLDDCHILRLRTDTNHPSENFGLPMGKKGFRMDISVTNPVSDFKVTKSYEKFVDLTGSTAHSGGVKLKDIGLSRLKATLVSIENGEFSSAKDTTRKFRLLDKAGAAVTNTFETIGEHGKVTLMGDELKIRVKGPGADFSIVFPESADIFLDNDCENKSTNDIGDLEMLYTLIEDKVAPGIVKFRLESEIDLTPDPTGTSGDPNGGLPCNIYQISKPGDPGDLPG